MSPLPGAVIGAAAALLLAFALHHPGRGAWPAGIAVLVAAGSAAARLPPARAARALPTGLRARLARTLYAADIAEGAALALAALLMLLDPTRAAAIATGLAGLLLMGALARLTLTAVLRRALAREADDRDPR